MGHPASQVLQPLVDHSFFYVVDIRSNPGAEPGERLWAPAGCPGGVALRKHPMCPVEDDELDALWEVGDTPGLLEALAPSAVYDDLGQAVEHSRTRRIRLGKRLPNHDDLWLTSPGGGLAVPCKPETPQGLRQALQRQYAAAVAGNKDAVSGLALLLGVVADV
jgi:hypothetical protein